jgi:signal transduction histidine kinase
MVAGPARAWHRRSVDGGPRRKSKAWATIVAWMPGERGRTLGFMRESGRSPLRWALRWWPAAVDLGLAVVVLVLTADQGTGTTDTELFGEAPTATRLVLGIGLAMLVLIRRVNPYPLLALGAGAWAVMGAPWGLMVAGYTISARPRRPRWFGALFGAVALAVFARMLVASKVGAWFALVVTVLVVGVPVLLGLWIGIRRALIAHLRDEAERLEREQFLKAEQAKAQERARIARELHDVVAHRVGLMVLHAGALEVSLADPEAAEQAGLVRQTGREALQELRQILGVLREGEDGVPLDPQPTLADLDRLVQQSRDAGMEVSVAVAGERHRLPATVERTAYRLVQEALTNAHKHAANAATEVEVRYRREWLEVTVRNDRPDGPRAGLALAGSGHGLLGLRERVTLLGGTFQAGPRLDGGFEVCASIPAQVPA